MAARGNCLNFEGAVCSFFFVCFHVHAAGRYISAVHLCPLQASAPVSHFDRPLTDLQSCLLNEKKQRGAHQFSISASKYRTFALPFTCSLRCQDSSFQTLKSAASQHGRTHSIFINCINAVMINDVYSA